MKIDLFQLCGHCWVFQICWHIECNTLTASSFRIWNSSTEIPTPPLALFVVMLPKAHLTLHSRMSGYRWVITPSWLSGPWRSFLYSSVYSCHLFLISSASVSQGTLGTQKNSPLSSKGGRNNIKEKKRNKRGRDGDPSQEGSLKKEISIQTWRNTLTGESVASLGRSEGNRTGRKNK